MFIAASLRLFVFPPVDDLRPVDAIVMLGGGGDRGPRAVDLADAGWSDTIVFASAYDEATATWATRPCNPGLNDLHAEVVCFHPEPATTRGEVRAVVALADENGWDQILVVASDDQITRARLLFDRCWAGSALFPGGVRHPWWPVRIGYEWGATIKALTIRRSC